MLKLTTPCFVEGGWIPDYNAGFGEDQSPEFHIEGIAPKAETMVITLDDLGHPLEPGYNHWCIFQTFFNKFHIFLHSFLIFIF